MLDLPGRDQQSILIDELFPHFSGCNAQPHDYPCPPLTAAGWRSRIPAIHVLKGLADYSCSLVHHARSLHHTPDHVHDLSGSVPVQDDHSMTFLDPSVKIFFNTSDCSQNRYQIISDLSANILSSMDSFPLFEAPVFDIHPILILPPLTGAQTTLLIAAYNLVSQTNTHLVDAVREAGAVYYGFRPMQDLLNDAMDLIPLLCKSCADDDASPVQKEFIKIYDQSIYTSEQELKNWTPVTDIDNYVYKTMVQICRQFNIARGTESLGHLDKAYSTSQMLISYIKETTKRINSYSYFLQYLCYFIDQYENLRSLVSTVNQSYNLFLHLAHISQLIVADELEHVIRLQPNNTDTLNRFYSATSLAGKVCDLSNSLITTVQSALDASMNLLIAAAMTSVLSDADALTLSLLIAATNFIDCLTGQTHSNHTELLQSNYNAYRTFCIGSDYLTTNLATMPAPNTDLSGCVLRALYQTFSAGITGRLSLECFAKTAESAKSAVDLKLFTCLRNLMDFYVSVFNEQYKTAHRYPYSLTPIGVYWKTAELLTKIDDLATVVDATITHYRQEVAANDVSNTALIVAAIGGSTTRLTQSIVDLSNNMNFSLINTTLQGLVNTVGQIQNNINIINQKLNVLSPIQNKVNDIKTVVDILANPNNMRLARDAV